MNCFSVIVTALMIVSLSFFGCGKKSGVNTSKVESSFSSAEPATKSDVQKAVDAAKAGDYAGALATLQKVAAKAKLTPEQQSALNDLVAQLQKQITAAAGKATEDAKKSLGDVQKSLPK
jgi:hypothetical protein